MRSPLSAVEGNQSAFDAARHTAEEGFIRVSGLTKEFPTQGATIRALDEFSLTVHEGEFVAVVGPSGCGKSTLLTLLAGLLPPTRGKIFIGDQEVRGPYTKLGIVFQNHVLLDWLTTLKNILFQVEMRRLPRKEYEQKARDLIAMVGLSGFENRYPYELSGGMKQRAAICRALLHDPQLLLMDEPFGALDALTRDQLCIDLEKIWLGSRKTVVFITHSVQEAVQLADRVVIMTPRPGKLYREITVDVPRPRFLHAARSPRFAAYVDEIKQAFLDQGVLKE